MCSAERVNVWKRLVEVVPDERGLELRYPHRQVIGSFTGSVKKLKLHCAELELVTIVKKNRREHPATRVARPRTRSLSLQRELRRISLGKERVQSRLIVYEVDVILLCDYLSSLLLKGTDAANVISVSMSQNDVLDGSSHLGLQQTLVPRRVERDRGIDDDAASRGGHKVRVTKADRLVNRIGYLDCFCLILTIPEQRLRVVGNRILNERNE